MYLSKLMYLYTALVSRSTLEKHHKCKMKTFTRTQYIQYLQAYDFLVLYICMFVLKCQLLTTVVISSFKWENMFYSILLESEV